MRRNIDSVFGILKDVTGIVWQKPERVKLGTGEPLIVLNAEMRIIKINTDNPHWVSIINQHCDHDETAVRIGLIEAICRDNNVIRADINLEILNTIQPYLIRLFDNAEQELRLKDLQEKQERELQARDKLFPDVSDSVKAPKTAEEIMEVHTKKIRTGRLYFHIGCPHCGLDDKVFTPATFEQYKSDFSEIRTWWIGLDEIHRNSAIDEVGTVFPDTLMTDKVITGEYSEDEIPKRWNAFLKYREIYYNEKNKKLGFTQAQRDELVDSYENETKSVTVLAKRYFVTKERIKAILEECGKSNRYNHELRKRVIFRFRDLLELSHNDVRELWKRTYKGQLPKKTDSSQKLIREILCEEYPTVGETKDQVYDRIGYWMKKDLQGKSGF